MKLLVFYVLGGGVTVATLTFQPAAVLGRHGRVEPADCLREGGAVDGAARDDRGGGVLGPAGQQVQADDREHPVLAQAGTIRLRPWRRVPFTAGGRRTWFDVALYLALVVSVVIPLVLPGVARPSLSAAPPDNTSGLVNPALLVPVIVLLVLAGLRDKTVFLAARGEQYLPALLFFTVLPFVDMIIALKLLIVVVWVGAGVSKFGPHFANVVPPMVRRRPRA